MTLQTLEKEELESNDEQEEVRKKNWLIIGRLENNRSWIALFVSPDMGKLLYFKQKD